MNNEQMHLIKVNAGWLPAIQEYRQEFKHTKHLLCGTGDLDRFEDMYAWFSNVQSLEVRDEPQIQFLYIRESDHKLVGMACVRPRDSAEGNVQYSVRPSERRKGYATRMLHDVLEYCRDTLGMAEVKIVITTKNSASQKVAFENEAVWHGVTFRPDYGDMVAEYIVTLAPQNGG